VKKSAGVVWTETSWGDKSQLKTFSNEVFTKMLVWRTSGCSCGARSRSETLRNRRLNS